MSQFNPVIGMEIHIELKTQSKMFCGCKADYFGHTPNSHCCPVCLGLPGALPVPNKRAVEFVILTGLALNCQIPFFSKFDRKNYFYPDLPKGYQISQYDLPLALKGKFAGVRIRRVHLEEDTAKMLHQPEATLIDFNRSGVPLMEIVTEPDIHSASQAKEFLKCLQQIVRYLGISDCDMEKGTMRLEANVSLAKLQNNKEMTLPKYKVEVKNLNSFRFVEKAIDFEIQRQQEILISGGQPIQETRGFNEAKGATFSQRIKEEAKDYRYFPEPDIPPMRFKKEDIERLRKSLPELPADKERRFIKKYGLSQYYATILTQTRNLADYFEKAAKIEPSLEPTKIANLIVNKKINLLSVSPSQLVSLVQKQTVKATFTDIRLVKIIEEVIKGNPKAVADFKKGKTGVIGFLVGQVMAKTRGQANPEQTAKILCRQLKTNG